jgi:hypothetical protein
MLLLSMGGQHAFIYAASHGHDSVLMALPIVPTREVPSLVTSPSRREGLVQKDKFWQGSQDRGSRRSLTKVYN